jgi:hypothetical protein
VGYEWPEWALAALRDLEAYEVVQALNANRRWPRWATGGPGAVRVLTIWARTERGRPLIVAVYQLSDWDWRIIGARVMQPTEVGEFEQWEATGDE